MVQFRLTKKFAVDMKASKLELPSLATASLFSSRPTERAAGGHCFFAHKNCQQRYKFTTQEEHMPANHKTFRDELNDAAMGLFSG